MKRLIYSSRKVETKTLNVKVSLISVMHNNVQIGFYIHCNYTGSIYGDPLCLRVTQDFPEFQSRYLVGPKGHVGIFDNIQHANRVITRINEKQNTYIYDDILVKVDDNPEYSVKFDSLEFKVVDHIYMNVPTPTQWLRDKPGRVMWEYVFRKICPKNVDDASQELLHDVFIEVLQHYKVHVHHYDQDVTNDNIDNLGLLTSSIHSKVHNSNIDIPKLTVADLKAYLKDIELIDCNQFKNVLEQFIVK